MMTARHIPLHRMRDRVLGQQAAQRIRLACRHDYVTAVSVGGFHADLPSGENIKHGLTPCAGETASCHLSPECFVERAKHLLAADSTPDERQDIGVDDL